MDPAGSWPSIGGWILALGALGAVALVWFKRRGPKKQCPKCGAYVHLEAHVCKYCDYEFAPA